MSSSSNDDSDSECQDFVCAAGPSPPVGVAGMPSIVDIGRRYGRTIPHGLTRVPINDNVGATMTSLSPSSPLYILSPSPSYILSPSAVVVQVKESPFAHPSIAWSILIVTVVGIIIYGIVEKEKSN